MSDEEITKTYYEEFGYAGRHLDIFHEPEGHTIRVTIIESPTAERSLETIVSELEWNYASLVRSIDLLHRKLEEDVRP